LQTISSKGSQKVLLFLGCKDTFLFQSRGIISDIGQTTILEPQIQLDPATNYFIPFCEVD